MGEEREREGEGRGGFERREDGHAGPNCGSEETLADFQESLNSAVTMMVSL